MSVKSNFGEDNMKTAKQYYSSPKSESSTHQFNLANIIRNIISDRTLSKGASDILIQLTLMAGRKGYCWPSIDTIVSLVKPGRTQVKLYLRELKDRGHIKVINRTGRASKYYLLDILPETSRPGRFSAHRKEYLRKENVTEKPNVILNLPQEETNSAGHRECENTEQFIEKKSAPTLAVHNKIIIKSVETKLNIPINNRDTVSAHQQTKFSSTVFDMSLVREILEVTGDKKSLGCFIKIVKNVPRNLIYAAISTLRIAISEGIVLKPGAYFVQTIKNYSPDLFTNQSPHSLGLPQSESNISIPTKRPESEPNIEIDWQANKENLQRIRAMLEGKLSHTKEIK